MRNIPDDNLAISVLIGLDNGVSGSGFFLRTETDLYLITAKHVLFDEKMKLRSNKAEIICQTKDIEDESTTIFDIDLAIIHTNNNIFYHKQKDVAAFAISTITKDPNSPNYITKNVQGVNLRQLGKSELISTKESSVLFLKDVLVSNDIFLYGYPSSLGLKELPQFDYKKPLLRKGIIASINKTQGTIILDCPVYYGNSGGPVVQVTIEGNNTYYNVIGVVSQFIPYTENWINKSNGIIHTEISNSGYSVSVAMDFVFEMLGIQKTQ